jgi:hypothetical protein
VLIDSNGRPVCSEMWRGKTADVATLIPVVDRLAETLAELQARRLLYTLWVRERADKLVRELVLNDPAPIVPLMMKKRGKETDYDSKTVMMLAGLHRLTQPSGGAEGRRRSGLDPRRTGA